MVPRSRPARCLAGRTATIIKVRQATATVKPIPDGYRSITAYLIVDDGPAALEFYKRAFGARERMRMDSPDGRLGHAELEIGDSVVMLASEHPEIGAVSPRTIGGTAVSLLLYTDDVDMVFARAVDNGATAVRPVQNQFYGDRSGTVQDPFGHHWSIATHIEDVSPEQIAERMSKASS